ncbi:MAG: lysozyme inhibitor [Alphaproteobacteria bacterium]|nr:lysozyme inhibitor [Alphaproteobacteria bacterium]
MDTKRSAGAMTARLGMIAGSLAIVMASLPACGGAPAPTKTTDGGDGSETAGGDTFTYTCLDNSQLTVTFHKDPSRLVLESAGRQTVLPQTISGSGARYSDEQTTFWIKGRDALYETQGGAVATNCSVAE